MTENEIALTRPRRAIIVGSVLPIAAVLAESLAGRPDRFPDWYLEPFWFAASTTTVLLAAAAVAKPSIRRLQAFGVVVVVWCICRSALNLATRPLPWPGLVSVAIWAGLALTVYGVGIAASINSGRTDTS